MQPASTRDIVLFNGTVTQNTTGATINIPQAWQGATFLLTLTTVSGTSPTFDVYIQRMLPSAAATDTAPGPPSGSLVADDMLHFLQMTTQSANARVANLISGVEPATANAIVLTGVDYTISQAALTAANARVCPISDNLRANIVTGGTSPSGFVSLVARLYAVGS